MKTVVSLLVGPVLIGVLAALAATAICSVTSATLSPGGGALLGAAFGLAGRAPAAGQTGTHGWVTGVVRGVVAGGTAALVVLLLQR